MAEVERKPQRTNHKGAVPTVVSGMSAADTQLIPNKGGDVILRIINGAAEATKATIVTPGEVDGNLVADLEIEVAATTTKILGPYDPAVYNDANGNLNLKLSKVTTVTLEATRVAL
jgi:hypothetical protein